MTNTGFTRETLGNSNYLATVFPCGQGIVNYQLQMLVGNDIKNILKASKKQKNNDVQLLFNVTGKTPLAKALEGKKFTKKDMLEFISGAVNAVTEVGEYQLPVSGIVFEPEYIFLENGKFTPEFIYMPDGSNNGGIAQFKSLVKSFVTDSKIEKTNDSFIEELLAILNNPVADPEALKNFANNYDKKKTPKKTPEKREIRPEPITPVNNAEFERFGNQNPADNPIPAPRPVAPVSPGVPQRPVIPGGAQKPTPGPVNPATPPAEKKKAGLDTKKIVFIVLQPVIIGVVVALCLSGLIFDENGAIIPEYIAGIALGAAGLDFVLFREFFMNAKNADKTDNKKNNAVQRKVTPVKQNTNIPGKQSVPTPGGQNTPAPGRQNVPIPGKQDTNPKQDDFQPGNRPDENYGKYYDADTEFYNPDDSGATELMDSGDTELMDGSSAPAAYLEFFENGLAMRIKLGNGTTSVGRRNFSVNNGRISKTHADFIARGGEYFVVDRNSTNGTHINGGEKLRPGEEYQIHIGDTITLADAELVLKK